VRLPVLLAGILLSGSLLAAPDEILLGRGEGYPLCSGRVAFAEQRCLVATYSRFDEAFRTRRVAKGPAARPLQRAAKEPAIRYRISPTASLERLSLEDFVAGNRNTGLLVLRDDLVLVERYQYGRSEEQRFASMSMAKTVLAMLVGVALQEKLIRSIDDPAQDYVPELKGHPYGETTLRHLLTMSSGVRFSEYYDGKDDVSELARRTFFQEGPGGVDTVLPFRERARPAGQGFSYSSAESQVLGLVLRAAVKRPLADYLSEKIWQPMGAEADATWAVDAGGYETGYAGINATLRDWGRFGLLLANDGRVDDRQVIPAGWVRTATTPEAPHLRVGTATKWNGYGYQTWLVSHPRGGGDRHMFAALGVRGQAIFVDPATKVVIVHTAVYEMLPEARAQQFGLFFGTLLSLRQHMSNP
jgi:CubicO group peptidase (beta-lactamase class C family)